MFKLMDRERVVLEDHILTNLNYITGDFEEESGVDDQTLVRNLKCVYTITFSNLLKKIYNHDEFNFDDNDYQTLLAMLDDIKYNADQTLQDQNSNNEDKKYANTSLRLVEKILNLDIEKDENFFQNVFTK